MEDDIQNFLPSVMFRGTPCIYIDVLPYKETNSFDLLHWLIYRGTTIEIDQFPDWKTEDISVKGSTINKSERKNIKNYIKHSKLSLAILNARKRQTTI